MQGVAAAKHAHLGCAPCVYSTLQRIVQVAVFTGRILNDMDGATIRSIKQFLDEAFY
jgi:hypothetical protein